jgi:Adaptive response protein AidB N-terminal domain
MTGLDSLRSPLSFLQSRLQDIPNREVLETGEKWWKSEGVAISDAIDRAGTPWLRMFDRLGKRVDEILYPREYQSILKRGCREGVVWRALEEKSLITTYLLMYDISFHDPGICCPYTVSLGTAVPLAKYGSAELQARFLPELLRKDDSVWQGATWMTEIKGGSDLGAAVETVARPTADGWWLTGDKYFASNANAELAVVAARPEGAAAGVRGLGAAISQGWHTQLFHTAAERQDCYAVCSDRRSGAEGQRRVPARFGRDGNLPDPRSVEPFARGQQRSKRGVGTACHVRSAFLCGTARCVW